MLLSKMFTKFGFMKSKTFCAYTSFILVLPWFIKTPASFGNSFKKSINWSDFACDENSLLHKISQFIFVFIFFLNSLNVN